MRLPHSPLLEALQDHAGTLGEKTAVIETDKQITYSKLFCNILKAASYLQNLGLEKGDKIILSANKEIEFIYLYFASHLLGVQNVIMDPGSSDFRWDYILNLTSPKVIFGKMYPGRSSVRYSDIDLDGCDEIDKPPLGLESDDVADIMFTTGTTASPKGVLLTNLNIYSSAKNINLYIGNTNTDTEVLGLPLCHSFGLGRLRCTLLAGGTLVLIGSFANVRLFFNSIERYNVTGFGMVPAIWNYIKKLSGNRIGQYSERIKYIEIGSAPMPLEDKELLLSLFPKSRICMHYGLTEASRATFMEFHRCRNNLKTIGRPVSGNVSVEIFSDKGDVLPAYQEGELCVSGDMVMKSYYLPNDNKNAFWGKFFRTGDWGYKDSDGYLYLISRKKELINVGGKKVNPIEIEDAIISLGFKDCACVGVRDSVLGEVPKAFIVRGDSTLDFEQIELLLRKKIEAYKVPVQYEWIDAVPMTASGKKQRLSLLK